MAEQFRFTETYNNRNIVRTGIDESFGTYYSGKAIDKLAEYETAEEEERMVVLLCKLDGTVYLLLSNSFADKFIPCRVREIEIGFYGIRLSLISEHDAIGHLEWHNIREIGETIFLTREDAEQALEDKQSNIADV